MPCPLDHGGLLLDAGVERPICCLLGNEHGQRHTAHRPGAVDHFFLHGFPFHSACVPLAGLEPALSTFGGWRLLLLDYRGVGGRSSRSGLRGASGTCWLRIHTALRPPWVSGWPEQPAFGGHRGTPRAGQSLYRYTRSPDWNRTNIPLRVMQVLSH